MKITKNQSSSVHVTGTEGGYKSKICSVWDPKLLTLWLWRHACSMYHISNSLVLMYVNVLNGKMCGRSRTSSVEGKGAVRACYTGEEESSREAEKKNNRKKSGQWLFQMRESLTLMPSCPQEMCSHRQRSGQPVHGASAAQRSELWHHCVLTCKAGRHCVGAGSF